MVQVLTDIETHIMAYGPCRCRTCPGDVLLDLTSASGLSAVASLALRRGLGSCRVADVAGTLFSNRIVGQKKKNTMHISLFRAISCCSSDSGTGQFPQPGEVLSTGWEAAREWLVQASSKAELPTSYAHKTTTLAVQTRTRCTDDSYAWIRCCGPAIVV